jgi:hypothetical protein
MLGLSRYLWNNFKKNINDAFNNWDAWSGGQGNWEEQDEYSKMVEKAKNKVDKVINHIESLNEIYLVFDLYKNTEGVFFTLAEAEQYCGKDKSRYYIKKIKFGKSGQVIRNFQQVIINTKTNEYDYIDEIEEEGTSGQVKTKKKGKLVTVLVQSTKGQAMRIAKEMLDGKTYL